MQRELRIGDEVQLVLSPLMVGITPEMWRYDRQSFRISKILYAGSSPNVRGAIYFELEGCVSEAGVPFGILREWIYPNRGGMTPGITAAIVNGGDR